jgi:CheY-like chemotaxis protein
VEGKLVILEKEKESAMLVVCPHCQTSIKIQVDLSLKLETPGAVSESVLPEPAPVSEIKLDSKKVAIAINGEGTREIIKEMLEDAQFEVRDVASLGALFPMVKEFCPATVLIDLSLPNATKIRLGEIIEKDLSPGRATLILVSPGYGKSQLSPEAQISFSNANDYIERGDIQKDLIRKIQAHLHSAALIEEPVVESVSPEGHVASAGHAVPEGHVASAGHVAPAGHVAHHVEPFFSPYSENVEVETLEEAEAPAPAVATTGHPSLFTSEESRFKEREAAKRLARIIVSDIILYNEKKVEAGVVNGTFYELLKEEIDEGRRYYNSRVALEVQKHADYFGDVFEGFLRKRKAALA